MVQLFIKEWEEIKPKVVIKRNKNFHESQLLSLNIKKAKKELLWQPRLNLDETVSLTVDWYKNYFLDNKVEYLSNYQIEYYIDK